jgi:ATP-dependent RNA helicase DDX49/DBP8
MVRVMLRHLEIDTTAMHSQMSQQQRISSLARFRTGLVPILIVTDVGSRYVSSSLLSFAITFLVIRFRICSF